MFFLNHYPLTSRKFIGLPVLGNFVCKTDIKICHKKLCPSLLYSVLYPLY